MVDSILLALILSAMALAVRKIYQDHKKGKSCGSCPGCNHPDAHKKC